MPSDFDAPGHRFPPTRQSAVAALGSSDAAEVAAAFETLVRAYWKPVYAHVRLRWKRGTEEARDLTQAFFARAFEKRHFSGYEPAKASFRTYLRGSLDNFVLEDDRAQKREKRGGGAVRLSLDFDVAEEELERAGPRDVHTAFDAEWTRSLFGGALAALEATCAADGKSLQFRAFKRYVVDGADTDDKPSYATVAAELGISVTDVTNYLAWARKAFRGAVLDELRAITSTEEEFRSEARTVLGVDP